MSPAFWFCIKNNTRVFVILILIIIIFLLYDRILGNVTGAIVNVDEYKVHETQDGRVDKTRSDMYLHFVDHRDNSIMEVPHVLRIIDENIEHLDSLFKVIKIY